MPKLLDDFSVARFVKDNYELHAEVRRIQREWVWLRFRLWIAVRLCYLAAWIGGIGLKINQEVGVIVTDKDSNEQRAITRTNDGSTGASK